MEFALVESLGKNGTGMNERTLFGSFFGKSIIANKRFYPIFRTSSFI
jgi:hypothetical protein